MSYLSLAYCTNYWNHHQAPVCGELASLLGEDRFKMCLFERPSEERLKLGYVNIVPNLKWVAGPPKTSNDMERLSQIICDADVAVLGACPQEVQAARASTGKLTFFMSERMMRQRFFQLRMLNPRFARGIRRLRSIVNRPNVHYLAIGAHAVADAKLLGVFDDRLWNWAYFVDPANGALRERSLTTVHLLWAGRFLRLKRVDMILKAMAMLGPVAKDCKVELIGNGPTRDAMERLAKRLKLADRVFFRESMTPEAVRERMAAADIYVFPSNRQEGWGAVVGESMCEGCVVVSSKAAGASKTLIEHGHTGFLFEDGDVAQLADILKQLIVNVDMRCRIGQAAAAHMQKLWHPRVGAESLVGLCQGLFGLAPMPEYHEGPCSHCVHHI
jgi:hypothetical protein